MTSLRKKRRDNIKKIFLMTIFMFLINIINVNATTSTFYEAEYIDNIYISKYQYSNNTIYYQKARFFREKNTNQIAYCIEPFRFFNELSTYESTININNISNEKLDKIKKIAYYGYGYENHTEPKWYAITQFLIWQETVENGEIFFTDKLNGHKIYPYQNEINEINNLININNLKPSFINQTHYIVENNNLILKDTNNTLSYFKTDKYKIENNNLILDNLTTGKYTINLIKKYNNYNNPIIFYQSPNSQNLVKLGNIEDENININVEVVNTNIIINKIDSETKNINPQGESSLNNAILGLYDENMNLLNEYTIINNKVEIKNIPFGIYHIKEIKPGIGYNLNNNTYTISINKDNLDHVITLENEVIKKKIVIEKKYGDYNDLKNESNIQFEIYNKDNILINTIKTNEAGVAEIYLPYGSYLIKQLNTTTGYQKIDPFFIEVKDNIEEKIELCDYKINVPNTHKNKPSFLKKLFTILLNILIC